MPALRKTLTHDWMKFAVVNVDVIVDPFTGVPSAVDVPSSAVGEQIACGTCGITLTASTARMDCLGDPCSG